jgi:hypothetical protein
MNTLKTWSLLRPRKKRKLRPINDTHTPHAMSCFLCSVV